MTAYKTYEQQADAIVEDLTNGFSMRTGTIVQTAEKELYRIVTEYNVTREITKKYGDTTTGAVNATKTVTEVENVVIATSVVKTAEVTTEGSLNVWTYNSTAPHWAMWWNN
jgi:hypothetical protein